MDFGLINSLQGLLFLSIAVAYAYLAKRIADRSLPADTYIENDGNLAVALRRAGLYIAIPLGMIGALSGPSAGTLLIDAKAMLIDGALVTLFLFATQKINDAVVIHGIDNCQAVKDGNVAVGLVEFSGYVATGLIAWGSFSGEGGGIISALVFFVLGQAVLLLVAFLYELLTPYKMVEEIRKGNVAAAVMLSGLMLSLGIVLYACITGDHVSWSADLLSFGVAAAKGVVCLLVLELVIDWLFLPNTEFAEEVEVKQNVANVFLGSAVRIGLALLIAGAVV